MAIASEGKFVWFDYVTPDVAKAVGFYSELFNWKTQQIPMGTAGTYTMLLVGDQGIGGILKAPPDAPQQSNWLGLLSTENAQATADKVRSLGGSVMMPATKQGDFGTMAVVADPLGGAFALWQPAKPESTGDYKGQPGFWVWNELYSQDPAKSVDFYTKLAGFTVETMEMKEGTYHVFNRDGKSRAGVMKPPVAMPQAWMPYVQVASCDETIAKAKQLGATVHATEDVPGIGRIGIFSDPSGGMLGVLQPPPM